jgi:uncharacterized protein YjbJ (UPF0337 family)
VRIDLRVHSHQHPARNKEIGLDHLIGKLRKGETMTNQLILEGNWNEIKGKLRQKWGQLTDDDLPQIRGEAEQLIGVIQRKTGDAREAIERYLQEVFGGAAAATGTAGDYAQQASEAVQQTAKQAADQVRSGYEEANRFIRERPKESLAVCLVVGVITGVVIALWLRSR